MHGVIFDATLIKDVPQPHWWRNHVDQLVTQIQPMLDRLAALETENKDLREQLEAKRKKAAS